MKVFILPFQLIAQLGRMQSWPERRAAVVGLALNAGEAVAKVAFYGLVCGLVAALAAGADRQVPAAIFGAMCAALALRSTLTFMADRFGFQAGYAGMCELRLRLVERLRALPLGFFERRRTGEVATLVAENVLMAEELATHILPSLVNHLVTAILLVLLIAVVDWRIGAIIALSVLAGLSAMQLMSARAARHHEQRAGQIAHLSGRMLEFVQGITVIRVLGLTAKRLTRLDDALRRLKDVSIRLEIFGGLAFLAFIAAIEFGFLAAIVAAANLHGAGSLSLPTIVVLAFVTQRLQAALTDAGPAGAMASYMSQGVRRIQGVFDEPLLPAAAIPVIPKGHDITFENVDFSYPTRMDQEPAIRGATFSIPHGACTVLTGRSGAGKSTLFKLMARFHDVDKGAIRIGGCDLRDIPPDQMSNLISMVFQDVRLISGSISDNIRMGCAKADDEDVIAAARDAGCHEFISRLPQGYATEVGEGGAFLSGGERQRLSIARALLKNAPILLLDEATSSVDGDNDRLISETIRVLSRTKTVVVIAHRSAAIEAADHIIQVDGGIVREV